MSVYKVINNYYNDLLSFLSYEDSANGGLEKLFSNITPDKKKIIITKLSEMMVKFDIAFINEMNYWDSTRKDNIWFAVIYIFMIILTIIVIIIILMLRIKEQTRQSKDFLSKIKSALTFLIIYQIIFSIFLVLFVNVKGTIKLCNGQISLLHDDLRIYSNYIFTGSHRDNINTFFKFLGYWKKNSKLNYTKAQKELTKDFCSYDSLLSLFNLDTSSSNSSKQKCTVTNDEKSNSKPSINSIEIQVYDILKTDIEASLISFYNEGIGFINVKKILNLSNPILMLKEANTIMGYYKFLGLKKIVADNNDPNDKTNAIVIQMVTNPIGKLIYEFQINNEDINESKLSEAIILNESDEKFSPELNNLITAFNYLAIFVFPIYIKISDKSSDFPYPNIITNMPNKIDLGHVDNKIFLQSIKTIFGKVYSSDYEKYMLTASVAEDINIVLIEILEKFVPLFRELYYKLFLYLKGGIWFPFNNKYIVNKILINLGTGITASLPEEYRINISNLIFESIITNIKSNFDIFAIKKGFLIETISSSLVTTDINILKFQTFIIDMILKENNAANIYIDQIRQLIEQIYNSVLTKKQLAASIEPADSYRYNNLEDFIDMIKTIQYEEFIRGLNIPFYHDIVSKFYANISESVNLRRPNMRNIYYSRQKTFSMWKLTIIMIVISLILFLVRYWMGVASEWKNIFSLEGVLRECDKKFAKRDYHIRILNWWIRMVVPSFVVLFTIAMLIAYYKKMKAAHYFNLEIIETNTNELKILLENFNAKMVEINSKIDITQGTKTIELITQITGEDKRDIFGFIKKIIDKFDKCNYILESAKNKLPFPYTEIVLNGLFTALVIVCILYVYFSYAPIKKLKDNKYLYKLKEELLLTDDLRFFDKKLDSLGICHNEDIDGIIISLKIIFFIFIIMFLVFYSVKIFSSANEFRNGLYNSFYYDESMCYNE